MGNAIGRFLVAVGATTVIVVIIDMFMTARVRQQPPTQTRNSGRIRGHYLDNSKTTVEWNCDEFPEVGRPTVITLHVSGGGGA